MERKEVRIVCIGDSITFGYGLEADQCWIGQLKSRHRFKILNAGINGDTTGGMAARFEYHVVKSDPEFVFIMGGANDIIQQRGLDEIKSNFVSMVEMAKENGIKVLMGLEPNPESSNVPEAWKALTDYNYVKDATFALRDWLINYCRAEGIEYIDFNEGLRSRFKSRYGIFFLDGVHPDINGHRMMANLAEEFFIANGVIDLEEDKVAPDERTITIWKKAENKNSEDSEK